MAMDRIGRAINAGRRWAMQQVERSIEITPSAAEEAATKRFKYLGMRHLFIISALEVLIETPSTTEQMVRDLHKKASWPPVPQRHP